jgi:hypothetical protein
MVQHELILKKCWEGPSSAHFALRILGTVFYFNGNKSFEEFRIFKYRKVGKGGKYTKCEVGIIGEFPRDRISVPLAALAPGVPVRPFAEGGRPASERPEAP